MSDNANNTTTLSTNELQARLQKAENIRARDGVVWKDKYERTHTIAAARELPDGTHVRLAGRVTALRWLGKLMFGRIYDINGEIQFSMSREEIGEEDYKFMKSNVDMGDFIGVDGELYHTTAGELTVRVKHYDILAKALRCSRRSKNLKPAAAIGLSSMASYPVSGPNFSNIRLLGLRTGPT